MRAIGFLMIAALLAAGAARADEFTVTTRLIEDRKAVFGTVESVDQTVARVRIGGTVDRLDVDEGSLVAEGEIIAMVGDPKLRLRLAAIDARIEAVRARRDLVALELGRVRELRRKGTVSQARLDEVETEIAVIESEIVALGAERAVIAREESEGAVLAPVAGRVLRVHVTAGSVVMPGETIASIAAETYVLRVELPERHARFVAVGDTVYVGGRGMETLAARMREGRVRQVYPEIERGRVVADVEVAGLGDFFVGERTRVYVSTGARAALVVPGAFLFRRFGVTFARLNDGREVVVQPGLPVDDGIEVLSGLAPGDVLVRP